MDSGRERLLAAAAALLAEHPDREPSTRELYEAAGVAAPTLYHHFGTKDGLLAAVVDDAFTRYLEHKRQLPRSDNLLDDFATAWDLHVEFGVEHPVLYSFMYGRPTGERPRAAVAADADVRQGLVELADLGLLRMDVDEALALTTAMAVGCVTQLHHDGGSATGPLSRQLRTAWIAALTGQAPDQSPEQAAKTLIAALGSVSTLFSPAENALFQQWLRAAAAYFRRAQPSARSSPRTTPTKRTTTTKGRHT